MTNTTIPSEFRQLVQEVGDEIKANFETIRAMADKDVQIDTVELDQSLIEVPKLYSKWSGLLADETLKLKDLYSFKENVKLERWKYYSGKQTDEYIAKHGILHEKILKTDIERYIACDEKISLVNDICSLQKALVDFVERTMKELGNRGYHIKSIIDWRKFTSGG